MKNTPSNLDRYIDKLDKRWQALPVRKQCRYTCCFFIAYLLLTAGAVFKVWHDVQTPDSDITIEHIENPLLKQNEKPSSVSDIISPDNLKNKTYERK